MEINFFPNIFLGKKYFYPKIVKTIKVFRISNITYKSWRKSWILATNASETRKIAFQNHELEFPKICICPLIPVLLSRSPLEGTFPIGCYILRPFFKNNSRIAIFWSQKLCKKSKKYLFRRKITFKRPTSRFCVFGWGWFLQGTPSINFRKFFQKNRVRHVFWLILRWKSRIRWHKFII